MSERLPPEDWLAQAKALHVGQKRRVRHNFEATAAMDVFNNGDSWTAYCHRCHMAGWVPKEHQQLAVTRVDECRVQPVPADTLHVSQATGYEQRCIWGLLVQKGCPPGIIPEEAIWFSRTANRILLRQGDQALGRALSPKQSPKWLQFGKWYGVPKVWWTRYRDVGPTVLVEDALSSYKLAKAIEHYAPESNVSVLATLGTRLPASVLPLVVNRTVLCMYDGDAAGRLGSEEIRKRLRVFGGTFRDVRPSVGDPKNMTLEKLYEAICT